MKVRNCGTIAHNSNGDNGNNYKATIRPSKIRKTRSVQQAIKGPVMTYAKNLNRKSVRRYLCAKQQLEQIKTNDIQKPTKTSLF